MGPRSENGERCLAVAMSRTVPQASLAPSREGSSVQGTGGWAVPSAQNRHLGLGGSSVFISLNEALVSVPVMEAASMFMFPSCVL